MAYTDCLGASFRKAVQLQFQGVLSAEGQTAPNVPSRYLTFPISGDKFLNELILSLFNIRVEGLRIFILWAKSELTEICNAGQTFAIIRSSTS